MHKDRIALETRIDALEKKLDKMESAIDEILENTIAKNLRVDAIENLATDIEDNLMTVSDSVEFIRDSFDNIDKKLDILATLLLPED